MDIIEIKKIIKSVDVVDLMINGKYIEFTNQFVIKKFVRRKVSFIHLLYHIFLFPMLLLHEISHYITMIFMFIKPQRLVIGSVLYNDYGGFVEFNEIPYNLRNIIISLSPISIGIIAIILPFLNIWFLLFTLYSLLSIKALTPSNVDYISAIISYKVLKDSKFLKDFDDEEMYVFEYACQQLNIKDFIKQISAI